MRCGNRTMQAFRRSRDGCPHLIHKRSQLIHKCSPHIHFSSENMHKNDSQTNIGCNVVRLCPLMSYDYMCSCRTFIAPHVVRHDNLIKTALKYICFVIQIYKNHRQFLLFHTSSLEMPDNPKRRRMRSKTSFDASFFVLAGKPCHILI